MLSIIFSGIVLWYCEQMYMNRSHYSLAVTIAGIVEVVFPALWFVFFHEKISNNILYIVQIFKSFSVKLQTFNIRLQNDI